MVTDVVSDKIKCIKGGNMDRLRGMKDSVMDAYVSLSSVMRTASDLRSASKDAECVEALTLINTNILHIIIRMEQVQRYLSDYIDNGTIK